MKNIQYVMLMKSDPPYSDIQVPSIILLWSRRFSYYCFPIKPECNWNVSKKVIIFVCTETLIQCNNIKGISINHWLPECNWNVSKKNLTKS